jgi:hypothetical protein
MAASMGAVLCAGARKTFCFATCNDSPTIRRSSRSCDWYGNQLEMLKLKDELYKIISQHSGQTLIKSTKIASVIMDDCWRSKGIRNDWWSIEKKLNKVRF